jgi:hypothetical protein
MASAHIPSRRSKQRSPQASYAASSTSVSPVVRSRSTRARSLVPQRGEVVDLGWKATQRRPSREDNNAPPPRSGPGCAGDAQREEPPASAGGPARRASRRAQAQEPHRPARGGGWARACGPGGPGARRARRVEDQRDPAHLAPGAAPAFGDRAMALRRRAWRRRPGRARRRRPAASAPRFRRDGRCRGARDGREPSLRHAVVARAHWRRRQQQHRRGWTAPSARRRSRAPAAVHRRVVDAGTAESARSSGPRGSVSRFLNQRQAWSGRAGRRSAAPASAVSATSTALVVCG